MPTVLESRRQSAAADLSNIVNEIDRYLQRDDADTESTEYTALREERDTAQANLSDLIATLDARRLAQHTPTLPDAEQVSPFRQILREYPASNPLVPIGRSHTAMIPYEAQRELQTGDPYFTPSPTRIQVSSDLPIITPSLDIVSKVQTGQRFDFVIPPPPELAVTVAEGARKHTVDWVSSRVEGSLEMDAHLIDVTRQTLEDDATAERTLRNWLVQGVRLRQDAKCQAAIAGATGTQTATGPNLLKALRNAKGVLSTLGITASAAYLHPDDAAALDGDIMDQSNSAPNSATVVWGMRVVESPAIAVGAPIVGAISRAVYLLYRSSIATYVTDSGTTEEATPRDRWSHNLLGILGEGRSKAEVVAPQLLVKCSITPPTTAAAKK